MNSNVQLEQFESRKDLYIAVTSRCESHFNKTLQENKRASFIVPGGTTPAPVFKNLSRSTLDWKNISVALSDERWLTADHLQSNQKLIAETLLINNAKSAQFVAMKNTSHTALEGLQECCNDYKSLVQPFSLTMLGMGGDGHIASLFPDCKEIGKALDLNNKELCTSIDASGCPVAGDFPERMSLTLSAIINSQLIILLVTGEKKLDVINAAIEKYQPTVYPVSALLHQQNAPVEIYWSK